MLACYVRGMLYPRCFLAGTLLLALSHLSCNLTPVQTTALTAALVQDACPLVGLLNGQAGTVCSDVAPLVAALVGGGVAGADGVPCKLAPITPDGTHGRGVVCAAYCGDMSTATASDPCPRIDAALRGKGARR